MKKSKPLISVILPDKLKDPTGGMGVQMKYLIKHLNKDFDFVVHAFPEDNNFPFYRNVFNFIPKVNHGGVVNLVGQTSYIQSVVKDAIENRMPDIIHATDYTEFLSGLTSRNILSNQKNKIPLLISVQLSSFLMHEAGLFCCFDPKSPDGNAIENATKEMELLGLKEADKIIHVSQTYKNIFSQIPNIDQKSIYIPNGVDLDEWKKFKKIQFSGDQKIKLVYLGRFSAQKNIYNLINSKIPSNIDLIFVGDQKTADPKLFNMLLEKIQNNKNVFYYGPAYNQDKIDILCSADAIIIPSVHECHPIIMHEALASKSVVISSFVGDMGKVLNEDFAINCGTETDTIEKALEQLSKMSKNEMEKRINLGFEVVKQYTWKDIAQKMKKVYLSLLKK